MKRIEIIPLGGIGEFGMNCMAVRYADEMIIIDAGMGFPEETPYGVDISVPNFDFLEQYRDDITAVVLTHGHEDHIGALPYFLKKFNVPVYGSRYTLALCERRLEEHELLNDILLHRVKANDSVEINSFTIEFINVTHSMIDCFALAITTPAGTIIHTGDFKVDDTPVVGQKTDLQTLERYGNEGVLALLCDSTNSTVPGRTPSEKAVIPAFAEIFEQSQGRIFVSTFSSSIHRLQVIFDLASEYGKKVCVIGRSMLKNVETADEMGVLDIMPNVRVSLADSRELDDDEIVYLVTGSQGEARAALWQIATGDYKGIRIRKGDTVVLSARIIPGNEKNISRLIGHIYKHGGNIIEEKRRLIHVSGHGSQEDIKIMVETVRPKFVVPVHGEYRMLFRLEEFVKNHLGYESEFIKLIENGETLELSENYAQVVEKREVGRSFIDEEGLSEIAYETVRERKKLAYGGTVSLVVAINKKTREIVSEPQFFYQGVAGIDLVNGFNDDARQVVAETLHTLPKEAFADKALLKESLRIGLMRFIKQETGTKPVIIPTIVEI